MKISNLWGRKHQVTLLVLGLLLFCPPHLFAVNRDGLLVLVPYAEVYLDDELQKGWKAYIHPSKGSWLIVSEDKTLCIAFAKTERYVMKIDYRDLRQTENPTVIDVPEGTNEEVQKYRPFFLDNQAYAEIPEVGVLKVKVPR